MANDITDVAALEACVGKVPGSMDLKVMDHLDASATRWLKSSPLAFFALGQADGVTMTIGAGEPGFVTTPEPRTLIFPAACLDHPDRLQVGQGFGSLFLLPGLCETLRVNGRVAAVGAQMSLAIDECYLHCAKALMRSDFWNPAGPCDAPDDAASLIDASRFIALATVDSSGRADVSPKGDPAGTMLRLQGTTAWYADRPGNRRVDSFRNILTQPRIAAAVLVPGSARIGWLSGRARISTDEAMRAAFSVGDRVPKIVTCVEDVQVQVEHSAAVARAGLWPSAPAPDDIDPAAMFVAHVKQSKARGLGAGIARAALSVPGLMEKGLQHDYKNNLY